MALKRWSEFMANVLKDPDAKAAYNKAVDELDAAWEVVCREGNCMWWVTPDGDIGGIGGMGCPCERND